MKFLLTVATLLAGLAAPALAEEATTLPPPQTQTQAALAPATEATAPAAVPQSKPAEVVPMSAPGMMEDGMSEGSGGGCHHSKTTVYLTN